LRARHISNDEAAVRGDVEAGRLNHAPVLLADLERLVRRGFAGIDDVHRVTAAVEHEVAAGRRLLETDRVFVGADDVRRKSAGGAEDFDSRCGDRMCDGCRDAERQRPASTRQVP
jgi:hypothetical protein